MDLRDSTAALRELVEKNARPYHERNTLAAESFRKTEGEPHRGHRVATAAEHIFANMPVRIRPGRAARRLASQLGAGRRSANPA
jgi:hypothetical protein